MWVESRTNGRCSEVTNHGCGAMVLDKARGGVAKDLVLTRERRKPGPEVLCAGCRVVLA